MNLNIRENQTKQKLDKKILIKSIIAMFFMVASYPALSVPSFWGNFDTGTVTGAGNRNWRYVERVAANRFTVISDSRGAYARVELRPGDNPAICCPGSERAEVSSMTDAADRRIYENLSSGTQRYTFSIKFDRTWQNIQYVKGVGAWGIFLQLHGLNNKRPPYAFSATDKIRLNMRVGDMSTDTVVAREFSNGALNPGKWIDFILTIKYAANNTGFVNVKRRDEGQTYFYEVLHIANTPTLPVGDHYWKHGFYRNAQPFTSIVYLDGFTREAVN